MLSCTKLSLIRDYSELQGLWTAHRWTYLQRNLRRNHFLASPCLPSRDRQEGQTRQHHCHPTACNRMGYPDYVLRRLRLLLHSRSRLLPHSVGHPVHSCQSLRGGSRRLAAQTRLSRRWPISRPGVILTIHSLWLSGKKSGLFFRLNASPLLAGGSSSTMACGAVHSLACLSKL
jgi:hypothetical protein